ncbi:MAG TPA: signal peptidase I [Syntrophales bacterium]|nr:signal peptidase I [Syntrophales bacterium]
MTGLQIGNDERDHPSPFPRENRQGGVFYHGSSMTPFFQPGDCLKLISCPVRDIRRGDVIVFRPSGEERLVVHRVIDKTAGRIHTKGDASDRPDPWVLAGEEIMGRVVSFERDGKKHAVHRGMAGRLQASLVLKLERLDVVISNLLHPLYRWLSRKGLLGRLLPASMTPTVVTFGRPDGTDMQILMGRRVIGRCMEGEGWVIRRPYRLIVDERLLTDTVGKACQEPGGAKCRELA